MSPTLLISYPGGSLPKSVCLKTSLSRWGACQTFGASSSLGRLAHFGAYQRQGCSAWLPQDPAAGLPPSLAWTLPLIRLDQPGQSARHRHSSRRRSFVSTIACWDGPTSVLTPWVNPVSLWLPPYWRACSSPCGTCDYGFAADCLNICWCDYQGTLVTYRNFLASPPRLL